VLSLDRAGRQSRRPIGALRHFLKVQTVLLLALVGALCSAQSWLKYSVSQNVGGSADETARQVLQDGSGNLFTLSTSGTGLVVAKRDSAGNVNWRSFFAGEPSGIALSPDGGVVVVGRIDRGNAPTLREILVLKFDVNGGLTWMRTLTGITGLSDPAIRAACTSDGSIYVGATVNQDAFSDVSLIKYSPAGDVLWQKTQGPNPDQEICLGVRPDAAGNILVFANRNNSQPVIYKYGPDGSLIWTFVSPTTGFAGNFAVDASGNSYLPINGGNPAAIKVSAAGVQVWKTSLGLINAPFAIAFSGTNAYVCGVQTATANCFVQKLGASGGVTWTATHTGPSGEPETLNSIVVGADGSVYAAGNRSFQGSAGIFTIKLTSAGVVSWSADHGVYTYTPPIIQPLPPVPPPPLIPTTLLMNGGGQPVTVSTINGPGSDTGYDTEICTDSSVGALVTAISPDLGGTNDSVDACATTSNGTTYLLGETQQDGGADVLVQQVRPDGTIGWIHPFGGPGPDLGYAISTMPDGGAVASYGQFNSITSMWDGRVRRFDPNGVTLWTTPLDGSNHIVSSTVASDGSVYVLGQDQSVIPYRFHVQKLSSTGSILWSQMFAGVGPSDDYPFKIALDSNGNLFACGNLWDGTRFLATLQRWDAATGNLLWTTTYASSGAGASGFTLLPDNKGDCYLIGSDWATSGRGLIRKYDVNGNLLFSRICTDTDTTGERFFAAALDSSGNVVIGGSAVKPDKNVDLLAAKYSSTGTQLWKALYNGVANLNDVGKYVAIDATGGIYVGGNLSGGATGRDYVLWRLNPDGSPGWPDSGDGFTHSAVIFDAGMNLPDTVGGVATDSLGNVFLAGTTFGSNNTFDLNAMKFGPSLASIFVSQSTPSTMIAGQTYFVSFSFLNSSSVPWTTAGGFSLGTLNPLANTTWGVSSAPLPTDPVNPGATAKFQVRLFAPTTAGTYNMQWSVIQTGAGPIGQPSQNIPVVVSVAPDAARYVGQTSPTTVKAGSIFSASLKMRNVGSNTWTQLAGYGLAPASGSNSWGITQVLVGANVAPGSDKSFSISCKAPTTPGTYVFRFQMKKGTTFFGDVSASKTITVTP